MDKFEYDLLMASSHKLVMKLRYYGVLNIIPCIICHNPVVDGHHPDYRKPSEVIWLCKIHHKQAHKGVLQFLGNDTIYINKDGKLYTIISNQRPIKLTKTQIKELLK